MSRKLTHEEFIDKIEDLRNGEYELLSKYDGNNKIIDGKKVHCTIKVKHVKCGYVWKPTVSNFAGSKHKKGTRCPMCQHPSAKRELDWVIEKVNKLTMGEYTLLSTEYNSNKEKLHFRHNNEECDNHKFMMTSNDFINADQRCPKCAELAKESKYVKFIRKFLKKNNIIFETQKTFDGCKNKKLLPFDFFLPDYNLLIEYDGVQHKYAWDNNQDKLSDTKRNDNIKNEYVKNNQDLSLLRISCKLEILAEVMNDIFILEDSTTIERYNLFYIE